MYLLTNLLSNAYGLGKKQEKLMRAAFMAVAVLATVKVDYSPRGIDNVPICTVGYRANPRPFEYLKKVL